MTPFGGARLWREKLSYLNHDLPETLDCLTIRQHNRWMTIAETVAAFTDAVTKCDLDRAMALCHEDFVFENVPLNPSVLAGRDNVRQLLERIYSDCAYAHYEILSQAEVGDTLLTERIDHHVWDDGAEAHIRVMGRFDMVDGRLTLWRDYYDAEQWHSNFEGGFVAYLQRRAAR